MSLERIVDRTANNIESEICKILSSVHESGPIAPSDFQTLAYIKKFYPEEFALYENKLIYLLGLFYKTHQPRSVVEAVYQSYADAIKEITGKVLTPVQANIYNSIRNRTYYSFSAPTSTGKSYLFRELIKDSDNDIIIVVPSRALIAEYIATILDILHDDTSVLVLQFLENVNIEKTNRRIYVITPERGGDLFKIIDQLNVGLFLFDEAQISEEPIRGMTFDALVKRVDKKLPNAKKVFTHPFVNNPEAQLEKHNFNVNAGAKAYEQHSVGKIFLSEKADKLKYFSPYTEDFSPSTIAHCPDELIADLLRADKSVLIYVSKNQIYKKEHLEKFNRYVELCPYITNINAKAIIAELREFIGAASTGAEKRSSMVELMERGVVIHHGSIPLKARLLIEKFVNEGYAKICFATSTLIQGINMPFDAVWIDNFKFFGGESEKVLGLKNLIGRAGRTQAASQVFDYGYVVVKESNRATFSERLNTDAFLSTSSSLDQDISTIKEDFRDLAEAIQTDTFNADLNLTEMQIERIKKSNLLEDISILLNHLIAGDSLITNSDYRSFTEKEKREIKTSFQNVYLSHLRKQELSKREKTVLSTAISILLWRVQSKSFKEILSLRYSYLARKDDQRQISNKLKKGELSKVEAHLYKERLKIRRSEQAVRLPIYNDTRWATLFNANQSIIDFDYDKLVYDTYDYLDKVIAQCLVDPITGALQIYFDQTKDSRAQTLSNYVRYGTNNNTEIWLLRYGLEPEDVEWIKELVISIDANRIVFDSTVDTLSEVKRRTIRRFL